MDRYKILLEALEKNWKEIDVIDAIANETANSIMDRWSSFNGLEKEFTEELKSVIIDAIHQWNLFLEQRNRETSKKEEQKRCAEIARNHPVFFKNGNIKSADIVRSEIAEAIEKSREA